MQFVDWRTSLSVTLLWLEFVSDQISRFKKWTFQKTWQFFFHACLQTFYQTYFLQIQKNHLVACFFSNKFVFLVFYLINKINLKHFLELVDQCLHMELTGVDRRSPPIPKNVWGWFYKSNKKTKKTNLLEKNQATSWFF